MKRKPRIVGDALLVGERFGYLTVLEPIREHKRFLRYLCKCDCGNYTVSAHHLLLKGDVVSCRCKSQKKDLRGYQFGWLLVLSRSKFLKEKGTSFPWRCWCMACFKPTLYTTYELMAGRTHCGCLRGPKARVLPKGTVPPQIGKVWEG